MENKSKDDIATLAPEGDIRKCPACGYNDGFHVSFQIEGSSKEGNIILICPNCHQRFQMGWKVRIS